MALKPKPINPGPGRPAFPQGKASDTWLQVRLTKSRKAHYTRAAHPWTLSEWVKLVLDKESDYNNPYNYCIDNNSAL